MILYIFVYFAITVIFIAVLAIIVFVLRDSFGG